MFGDLGKMAGLMKNFGTIKSNVEKAKSDLANLELEVKSPCGQVKVIITGDLIVRKVMIEPSLASCGDADKLDSIVTATVNLAIFTAKDAAAKKLSEAAGGIDLSKFA